MCTTAKRRPGRAESRPQSEGPFVTPVGSICREIPPVITPSAGHSLISHIPRNIVIICENTSRLRHFPRRLHPRPPPRRPRRWRRGRRRGGGACEGDAGGRRLSGAAAAAAAAVAVAVGRWPPQPWGEPEAAETEGKVCHFPQGLEEQP